MFTPSLGSDHGAVHGHNLVWNRVVVRCELVLLLLTNENRIPTDKRVWLNVAFTVGIRFGLSHGPFVEARYGPAIGLGEEEES